MPSSFNLIPQRNVPGKGWIDCADHTAGRFAICEVKTHGHGKSKRVARKTIAAFKTKAEAVEFHARLCRKGHDRGLRKPKAKVLYHSLTLNEYNELKEKGTI